MLQAAVCVTLVAWLSLSAIGICREGIARRAENPMQSVYTPEGVAEKLAPIAPLFFAGLGLLVIGLVLGVKDENAQRPVKDAEVHRDLLVSRIARPSEAMQRERRAQRRLLMAGRGLFALCMVPVLIYLVNPAHFPQDDTEGMFIGLLRVFLPWTAAALAALAVTSALREKSVLRETQAAMEQLKTERAAGEGTVSGPVDPPKKSGALQAVLIVAAVFFILMGVLNGSARDVINKAIAICTECVGLG